MENKNVFIGVDLTGDDLAIICLNIDQETFYFEFNDCDLTKADVNLLNRMMFINNTEKSIYYKSGEKGITFIRDDKEIVQEHIENIINQYCMNSNVKFIGNIKPREFVKFYELLDTFKESDTINIDDNYLSLDAIELALNMISVSNDEIFKIDEKENQIITTLLVKNLYEEVKKFKQ